MRAWQRGRGIKEKTMGEKTTMSVLEGNNFVVSDLRGDIDASLSEPLGLFAWDTRFLSRWLLTVDGQRPNVLSTDDLDYFYVQFFLVPGTGTVYVDSDLSIIRKRAVGNGFHEDVTILNHKDKPVDLKVHMEAAADFADLFEVKDALKKKGEFYHRIESDRLLLGYRREAFTRETWIISSAKADIDEHGLSFAVHIEPHGKWTTSLEVVTVLVGFGENHEETTGGHGGPQARSEMKRSLEKLGEALPRLSCDWPSLQVTYRRSLVDLAALRFFPLTLPGQALPAAGLPWFMTLFGRDSMTVSYQALPFTSALAETTLQALAQLQGTRVDDFRDEEPGKIMHEMRFGEMTAFEERPHSPYYGSADATPFFLILLDEVERWTGNVTLVRQLEMEARAALTWIDTYGDRNGDGYVEYSRRNKETIVHHLMGPKLYSGWGVRTMAEGEGSYNPIGYHLGTVWPHDNAFIAMGLRRYGYREEAARVAMGMLEAATYFKGRLPEAFAGYPRQLTEFPVEYPTACSPQAWASGAPLLLLRAILGLEPIGDHLLVDPAIPSMLGQLELLDIPGRWGRIDAFARGRVNIPAVGDSAPLS